MSKINLEQEINDIINCHKKVFDYLCFEIPFRVIYALYIAYKNLKENNKNEYIRK